jgi:hypothetical protein
MAMMLGSARLRGIACEDDSSSDRGQPENANPQDAGGSQVCAKHELPAPNFCLDHRFVRLNYARYRPRALLKSYNSNGVFPTNGISGRCSGVTPCIPTLFFALLQPNEAERSG